MNPLHAFAIAAALIAAPAAAQPMSGPHQHHPMPGSQMSPGQYVMMAGASDLYEIQSSRLVLQSTRDARVRDFANMMIRHHTKSTADVTRAARMARVRVAPPRLMPDQARMIAELRASRGGPARDAAYLSQQRTAHDMALALHQSYADNGTAAPLRRAAAGVVPVVQQHIQMLQTMAPAGAM